MDIIVLGTCCKRAVQTLENVKTAARALGLACEIKSTNDPIEIARYGVMQNPALVLNGKVVSYGKFLSVDDATVLIGKTVGGV